MRITRPAAGLALTLLAAGSVWTLPARAETTTAAGSDDDAAALVRLQRAAEAVGTVAYSGTKVMTTWDGGRARTVVLTVDHSHPDQAAAAQAGPISSEALNLLAEGHAISTDGSGAVIGRPATVVLASQTGPGGRESARLWVDDATGLPLRQEVYDDGGLLRRLTTYTSLQVAATAAAGPAAPAKPEQAWPDVVPVAELSVWRKQGWPCPDDLPGGLKLLGARQSGTASGPVLQLTYSDGIDDASLFVQQGTLDASGLNGYTEQSWGDAEVHVAADGRGGVVWQGDDVVFTLVSDVPQPESEQIVAALPAPRDGGVVDSVLGAGRAVGGLFAAAGGTLVGWMS